MTFGNSDECSDSLARVVIGSCKSNVVLSTTHITRATTNHNTGQSITTYLKIHKRTTLLLFSQALVFVFERISAMQSQTCSQCVEIWRCAGATCTKPDRDGNARLRGIGSKSKGGMPQI